MEIVTLDDYRNISETRVSGRHVCDRPVSPGFLHEASDFVVEKTKNLPTDCSVAVNGDSFIVSTSDERNRMYYLHVSKDGPSHVITSVFEHGKVVDCEVFDIYEDGGFDAYGSRLADDDVDRALDAMSVSSFGFGMGKSDYLNGLLMKSREDDLGISDKRDYYYDDRCDVCEFSFDKTFSRLREKGVLEIDDFVGFSHTLELSKLSDKTRAYVDKLSGDGLCVIVPDVDTVAVLMDTHAMDTAGMSGTYFVDTREHGSFLVDISPGFGSCNGEYAEVWSSITALSFDAANEVRGQLVANASELSATWRDRNWYEPDADSCEPAKRLCELVRSLRSAEPHKETFESRYGSPVWPNIVSTLARLDRFGIERVSAVSQDVREALSDLDDVSGSGQGDHEEHVPTV